MLFRQYLSGQLFLCAYVLLELISPVAAKAGTNIADTAQMNTQLDSAWAMVKRHDPSSLSKISKVLSETRTIQYRQGEADAAVPVTRLEA
jgi:hypothetical protein